MKKTNSTKRKVLLFCLIMLAGFQARSASVNLDAVYSQDFDGIGTESVATLPNGWKIEKQTHNSGALFGTYESAATQTEQIGGNVMLSNAPNGIYNFGAGDAATATDRAIGGISTGSGQNGGNATKYINVFLKLTNAGSEAINHFAIEYDVEKYRKGSNGAGFCMQLYYSEDGVDWLSAGGNFYTFFPADGATEGYETTPGASIHVSANLLRSLAAGADLYLAWHYSAGPEAGNSNASQALGIDNVIIEGKNTPPPAESVATIAVGSDYLQNFDAIGLAQTATLPAGWKIEKRLDAPRTLGSYAAATTQTEQIGGNNIASNAKNGIYNFGAGDATTSEDRAIGGISTGVEGGTRGINMMVKLKNTGETEIKSLNIEYDVEKYRKGANGAGFALQLYYSENGNDWISAGNSFYTFFSTDGTTEGYAAAPGVSEHVAAVLPRSIAGGDYLYLAWNYSVASGSDASAAQALGIDNIAINGSESGVPPVPVTLEVKPKNAVLLLDQPKQGLKILSLNNSLIFNNDQPAIFDQLTASTGKSTQWQMEAYLGQSLQYYYETAANPRTLVRTQPWTHIILQEQSSKPRTDPDEFYKWAGIWVDYIRANCPNPNVKIIITLNWAYTDAADYAADIAKLQASYRRVEQDFGVGISPIGLAYDRIRTIDGVAAKNALYTDNRHPTMKATYLAACLLYACMFNETPVGIAYRPTGVSEADAALMQQRAWETYQNYDPIVNDFAGTVKYSCSALDQFDQPFRLEQNELQWSSDGGGSFADNVFTANAAGIFTVSAKISDETLLANTGLRVVSNFEIQANETRTAAEYQPCHADIIFHSDSNSGTGQLTGTEAAGLTVNGRIILKKTFTAEKWYSAGFPFTTTTYDVENIKTNLRPGDDFDAKTFDGNLQDTFFIAKKIDKNKGYVLKFQPEADDETIVFYSAVGEKLKNVDEAGLTAALNLSESGYYFVANPSASNLTLSTPNKYYLFDGDKNFVLLTEGRAVVMPFESFIVAHNVTGSVLKTAFDVEKTVETGNAFLLPDADPIIKIEYYNLQGIKMEKTQSTGLYIVRTTHLSNKTETVKKFIER